LIAPHLQKKVQQRITIKTTKMAGNGNTVNDKTTRFNQHRMPDYKKNVLPLDY